MHAYSEIECPVLSVHIPPQLRYLSAGAAEVTVSGDTVREALEALEHQHPGFAALIRTGAADPHYHVYLGASDVADLHGFDTPIGPEELLSIVAADR